MSNTRTETLAADDGGTSTATVVVPDAVSGPAVLSFQEEHLGLIGAAHERGELVMAGALAEPADGAVLVFRGESGAAAEAFVAADPYVAAGLVSSWRVRPWTVVVGAPS